jgi:hypothetical protein
MPDRSASEQIERLFAQRARALSARYAAGEITLGQWQVEMRYDVKVAHGLQLIAGADGDPTRISPDDWLRLGPQLRKQYGYLEDFAREIQAGQVTSPDALAARSELYAKSAGREYWAQATKAVRLPAMPKDGSSECHGNCGCEWVDNGDGSWRWQLGKADNCPTCAQRAREWASYREDK